MKIYLLLLGLFAFGESLELTRDHTYVPDNDDDDDNGNDDGAEQPAPAAAPRVVAYRTQSGNTQDKRGRVDAITLPEKVVAYRNATRRP